MSNLCDHENASDNETGKDVIVALKPNSDLDKIVLGRQKLLFLIILHRFWKKHIVFVVFLLLLLLVIGLLNMIGLIVVGDRRGRRTRFLARNQFPILHFFSSPLLPHLKKKK